jgi:uncharacterized membrane protein YkoI
MRRVKCMTCLLAALLMSAALAPAEARRDARSDRLETPRQEGISLDEAVARVRRETGGHVLSAQAREERGGTTYRIKVLLPNGTMRVISVDAASGETN